MTVCLSVCPSVCPSVRHAGCHAQFGLVVKCVGYKKKDGRFESRRSKYGFLPLFRGFSGALSTNPSSNPTPSKRPSVREAGARAFRSTSSSLNPVSKLKESSKGPVAFGQASELKTRRRRSLIKIPRRVK